MIPFSPEDRDLMIRTVLGEAANQSEAGQAAVAHVIRNRLLSGRYGSGVADVVLAKNQFEPWSRRSRELLAISPSSPEYQRAGRIVDAVLSGAVADPTTGATHFYSPGAQAALGRQPPSWARGIGLKIGDHVFYAPDGGVARSQFAAEPPIPAIPVPMRQPMQGQVPSATTAPSMPEAMGLFARSAYMQRDPEIGQFLDPQFAAQAQMAPVKNPLAGLLGLFASPGT